MEVQLYQNLLELNWNLLFSFITIVVLFLILKKFFFQKVHEFMETREKEVIDSMENAKKTNEEAEALLADYNEKISHAEEEKAAIILEGRSQAEVQAKEILADANIQAQEMLDKAAVEIEREKKQAEQELKKETSVLVMEAAKRVISDSIDEESQDAIIERMMREQVNLDGSKSGE